MEKQHIKATSLGSMVRIYGALSSESANFLTQKLEDIVMTEVTVSQLAGVIGTPIERLLKQMQEAGLAHSKPNHLVSDEDKQMLLTYLKSSHSEERGELRKITLKRKTLYPEDGVGRALKKQLVEVGGKGTDTKHNVIGDEVSQLSQVTSKASADISADMLSSEICVSEKYILDDSYELWDKFSEYEKYNPFVGEYKTVHVEVKKLLVKKQEIEN